MDVSRLQTYSPKQLTQYVNSAILFFYFSPKYFPYGWPVVAKACRRYD